MLKKWLYPLYVVLSISVVIVALIFFRDRKPGEPYAESMTLNISRELTVNYGETYTLPDTYLIIQPASASELLSHTVINQAGEVADLKFDGKSFEAVAIGYFYIKFSIPAKNNTLTETLKIHIVEPEEDHISAIQKITILTIDEVYSLTDMFDLTYPENAEILVTPSNANVVYYDSTQKLIVKNTGSITITLEISYKSQIQYFAFNFQLIDPDIDDSPSETPGEPETNEPSAEPDTTNKITINLPEIKDTIVLSKGETYEIAYSVTKDGLEVDQSIIAVFADNSCSVLFTIAPYIFIQANSIGSTTLTITSLEDTSVSIVITVIVK